MAVSAQAVSAPRLLVNQYDYAGCDTGANFDERGTLRVDYGGELGLQYNPTTISQFALGCYHNWRRSGDPVQRRIYLDQIRWLRANAVYDSTELAAYEYGFAWSYGLRPGWRSGIAQGQAISALIRYYYDTEDDSVLPLIRRLKNYMLLPREHGGLVARSPEGGLWIEEFPSNPPSFVWNGFVSAVFGLYEFTRLFPDDRETRAQFDAAIASLKNSAAYYDTGNWTYLDRHDTPHPKATNNYQLGHYFQMRTLAQVTRDPFFQDLALRWQSFYEDVHFNARGNMTINQRGVTRAHAALPAHLPADELRGNAEVVEVTPYMEGYGVDRLFDRDDTTYLAPAVNGTTVLQLKLRRPVAADTLVLALYNPELYPRNLQIQIREPGDSQLRTVGYEFAPSRINLAYYFRRSTVEEIRIVSAENSGQDRLVLAELYLGVGRPSVATHPDFGSYLTGIYEMTAPEFGVSVARAGSEGRITVIYRCAKSTEAVEKQPWAFDFVDPLKANSQSVKGRYCQFKVLCSKEAAASGWKNFQVRGAILTSPQAAGKPGRENQQASALARAP